MTKRRADKLRELFGGRKRELLVGERDSFLVGERDSFLVGERERVVVGVEAFCFELLSYFGGREKFRFCLRSFVSLWGLRGQRVRERALVHERKKGRRANQRTSREVATSLFLFIWELNVSGVCEASSVK